jgi:RND family efflux transporter MFP subunit
MKKYIWCVLLLSLFLSPALLAQNRATDVRSIALTTSKVEKKISKVGTVFPLQEVVISSLNEGLVEKLLLEEGQRVKKGQILAHVGAVDNKISLDEARVSLNQQKSSLEYSKKNYTRQNNLYKKGIINLSQFEQIESRHKQNELTERSARLKVKRARLNYDRSIIKSPIDGVIDQKFFEVGEFARKGDSVYKIIRSDKLKIEFAINENEIKDFSKGQAAKIYLDALEGQEYSGVVGKISPSANIQNKTFQVEVELENQKGEIRPGITARIELQIAKEGERILIPLSAIVEGTKGRLVYLNENGVAKEVLISTEENIDDKVVVQKGLKVGDRLIVQGQQFLNNNDKVNDLAQ